MKKEMILERLEKMTARSAWEKGVILYAFLILENIDDDTELTRDNVEEILLNGASSWEQYSWGGSALIYDGDIAKTLYTPSELKRTKDGERRPNSNEKWLDVQARALRQAYWKIKKSIR